MKLNNPYLLPICFAAAAHGALLFGFTKNPAPVKQATARVPPVIFVLAPDVEPPVVVESETAPAQTKPPIAAPQPFRSEEPVAVETTSPFVITPPPLVAVSSEDVRQILHLDQGVVGGIGDAISKVGIVSGDVLDNAPRTRFQASPLYPFQGKKEGMSGEVFVDFTVDEQGRVVEPRIVKSSHPIFEEPTLRAVAKWQFEPGRRNGRIVKFRMTVPVVFSLNEGS